MSIKPKSAEELHRGGQRTSLDLAVELLRHVSFMACAVPCRYCADADLFDADVGWLADREAARVNALARATELEGLREKGLLTDADRAEYRKIKAAHLVDGGDDVEIQLRLIIARMRKFDELRAAARYVTDLFFRSEVNGQSWPTDAERAMEKLRELLGDD